MVILVIHFAIVIIISIYFIGICMFYYDHNIIASFAVKCSHVLIFDTADLEKVVHLKKTFPRYKLYGKCLFKVDNLFKIGCILTAYGHLASQGGNTRRRRTPKTKVRHCQRKRQSRPNERFTIIGYILSSSTI